MTSPRRPRRRLRGGIRLLAAAFVTAGVLLGSGARAQAESADDRVSELYRQGRAARDRGDRQKALELLLEAWRLRKTHDVAASLAQVEHELGKVRDAVEHLSWAVNHLPAEADPERARRVREALERIRKEVVTLQIAIEPDTAEVFVNGRSLGIARTLEKEIFADPGSIQISATLDGHESWSSTLRGDAGATHAVNGRLTSSTAASSAPAPSRSELSQASPYGPNGSPSPAPAASKANWTPAIASATATGVALVAGVTFWVLAGSSQSDADEALDQLEGRGRCGPGTPFASQCNEIKADLDSADSFRVAAISAFGVTLAGAAVAYILWPRGSRTADTTVRAAPLLSPSFAGGTLETRF